MLSSAQQSVRMYLVADKYLFPSALLVTRFLNFRSCCRYCITFAFRVSLANAFVDSSAHQSLRMNLP